MGYRTISNADLPYAVKARNWVNGLANKLQAPLAELAKAWAGKPIAKADGSSRKDFKTAFEAAVKAVLGKEADNVWLEVSEYSVIAHVKVCVSGNNHAHYASVTHYFANCKQGVLVIDERDFGDLRKTDWTVAEVNKRAEKIRELESALSKAQSALYDFS